MSSNKSFNQISAFLKIHWQIFLALSVALVILIIYLNSGRANFDQNLKSIQSSPEVNQVKVNQSSQGQTLATIECQDGTKYEVYLPPNETDFAAFKASKCGQ